MKIFLLGLPGSGKSTLGKGLSKKLRVVFVDLDAEIERTAEKKITALFAEEGEEKFREREQAELVKWCAASVDFVMATGGGAPCYHNNLGVMNTAGTTVFLDVPVETITERILREGLSERPLLASLPPGQLSEKLNSLESARRVYYSQARVILRGAAITLEELADKTGK